MRTTKTMTTEPHSEPENFTKTISFESGEFAILDAEVAKSLKDKVSLSSHAVFVATKQSRENGAHFKITAEYDDATLRRLVIEPAMEGEMENHHQMEEGIQLHGHGGDPVERKLKRKDPTGCRPNVAKTASKNKKHTGKGDPKTMLTKGSQPVKQRIDQKISIKGAKLDNYGQPLHKTNTSPLETECMDLLATAKTGLLSEDYLNSVNSLRKIRTLLANVRDNNRVSGKSFDLVYDVVRQLDEHWHKSACVWVENIARKGFLDV